MNRENIQKVRDVIAGLPAWRFTMEWYAAERDGDDVLAPKLAHTCNTAGCIAGWTVAALNAPLSGTWDTGDKAAILLGLSATQQHQLFTPPAHDVAGRYSRAHAVRALDHLLATGEVNWPITRRAKPQKTPQVAGDKGPGRTP
jgi:hypothetical protein